MTLQYSELERVWQNPARLHAARTEAAEAARAASVPAAPACRLVSQQHGGTATPPYGGAYDPTHADSAYAAFATGSAWQPPPSYMGDGFRGYDHVYEQEATARVGDEFRAAFERATGEGTEISSPSEPSGGRAIVNAYPPTQRTEESPCRSRDMLDLALFALSGLLTILVLEQAIQLGARMGG
jgi:hypothetical protein